MDDELTLPFLAHPSRIHRGNMKLTNMLIHLSWEANTLPPQICSRENWSYKSGRVNKILSNPFRCDIYRSQKVSRQMKICVPLKLASAWLRASRQLSRRSGGRYEIRLHIRCDGCRVFRTWFLVEPEPRDRPARSPAEH